MKKISRFSKNKDMSKVVKSKTLFEDISRNLDCKIKDDNGEHLTDHFFYTKQNIKYSHFHVL